jgi:hypothetical protein
MAYSADVYEQIRRATGEWGDSTYEDGYFDRFLDDTGGDVNGAAALVWQEKAASYSKLVDTTEAGSSRKNSQLYTNAIGMMEKYQSMADDGAAVDAATYSTTRRIVRL